MKMLRKLNDYISDNTVKVITTNNYINITNYSKIIDFNSNNIDVDLGNCVILINGKDLVINKMYDNELLIKGKINSITYR